MTIEVTRRLFTVDEYYQMAEAGILAEDDRVELLEGEVVKMSPIGMRHAACVDRLTALFSHRLGKRAIVRVQGPIRLDRYSEPQPDLALLRPRDDFYAQSHPEPQDVLLAVEVAETSLAFDRDKKIPLYVRAGVQETWLVDLYGEAVIVYRQPSAEGYGQQYRVSRDKMISPQAFPDLEIAASKILT